MELWQLRQRQELPLEIKEKMSLDRIKDFYNKNEGNVYVSFSGGKDSTVLLDLVRKIDINIPAVFIDTGLEYPEIRKFVKTINNVIWLKPKKKFKDVITTHGYPVISKTVSMGIDRYNKGDFVQKELRKNGGINWSTGKNQQRSIPKKYHFLLDAPFKCSDKCCYYLKKAPLMKYNKDSGNKGFIGTMATDSRNRELTYLQKGCNNYNAAIPTSTPLAFWNTNDIWEYIKKYNLTYSSIYDMGEHNTGCIFCMFGIMYDDKNNNRFHRLKQYHPELYNYCINKLGIGKVLDYIDITY